MSEENEWRYGATGVQHAFTPTENGRFYRFSVCGMSDIDRADSPSGVKKLHKCNQCKRILGGVPSRPRKTPWQKIRDAANRGTGCHLTADDVARLAYDEAIVTRADFDDEGEDYDDVAGKEDERGSGREGQAGREQEVGSVRGVRFPRRCGQGEEREEARGTRRGLQDPQDQPRHLRAEVQAAQEQGGVDTSAGVSAEEGVGEEIDANLEGEAVARIVDRENRNLLALASLSGDECEPIDTMSVIESYTSRYGEDGWFKLLNREMQRVLSERFRKIREEISGSQ